MTIDSGHDEYEKRREDERVPEFIYPPNTSSGSHTPMNSVCCFASL